jgi:hypothetical protein
MEFIGCLKNARYSSGRLPKSGQLMDRWRAVWRAIAALAVLFRVLP